jgi:hypothetical protein
MTQEIPDSRPRSRVFDTPQALLYFYCPRNKAFKILIRHRVPGALSPFKIEFPVGSIAIIALILPGLDWGIIQLAGPVIECVMMTAGPIFSSRAVTAFVVKDKLSPKSGIFATSELKS